MSGLIAFTPDFVPYRYPDRFQRRAVLVPLTGKIAKGAAMPSNVVAKTL